MQPVSKAKAGYTINVDRLRLVSAPGHLGVRFYDMGATLPVSGTAALTDGTSKLLGDLSLDGSQAPQLELLLHGGKELLCIPSFSHGAAKEKLGNTLLTPGNYYAIVLEYIDVEVDVYGASMTPAINRYPNGYAWTTEDLTTTITTLGTYADIMFLMHAAQTTWVESILLEFDGDPKGGSYLIAAEDALMNMLPLAIGNARPLTKAFGFDKRQPPLEPGGKLELYFSAPQDIEARWVTMTVGHWSDDLGPYTVVP